MATPFYAPLIRFTVITTCLLSCVISYGAETRSAALVVMDGKSPRYVTTSALGGLETRGTSVTDRSIFEITDLNGGELEDFDTIVIKWDTSVWAVYEGEVRRHPKKGSDKERTEFRIRTIGPLYVLQIKSEELVGEPARNGSLPLVSELGDAMVLHIDWDARVSE